jgi:hypothetical protein
VRRPQTGWFIATRWALAAETLSLAASDIAPNAAKAVRHDVVIRRVRIVTPCKLPS